MRRYALWALVCALVSMLACGASAIAQTTSPEATVPPVPTQPDVDEPTPPPTVAPPQETEVPVDEPVIPGTTTEDDDDDGLSSTAILLLILGGVALVLIAFGVAMASRRRPGDPDTRI